MNPNMVKFAAHVILDRVGLAVAGKLASDGAGQFCDLVPTDAHPNDSFTVRFQVGWRSAEVSFVAGKFAAPLVAQMGHSSVEAKEIFRTFASALQAKKIRISMRVNGADISAMSPENWPSEWSRLDLSLRLSPFISEQADDAALEVLVLDLVVPIFAMLATLIGVEENEPLSTGEPEGRAIQSSVTRYERKKINREACIQLKGSRCRVCGFDFATFYGPVGIGYIEVHHTVPVSSVGPDYKINVVTDLEPVCSNCHSMAHREEPPIPIEALRQIVEKRRQAASP
jgi:5-methylcytosine-specific restriction protein A